MTWEWFGYAVTIAFVVLFILPLVIVALVAAYRMWRDILRGNL